VAGSELAAIEQHCLGRSRDVRARQCLFLVLRYGPCSKCCPLESSRREIISDQKERPHIWQQPANTSCTCIEGLRLWQRRTYTALVNPRFAAELIFSLVWGMCGGGESFPTFPLTLMRLCGVVDVLRVGPHKQEGKGHVRSSHSSRDPHRVAGLYLMRHVPLTCRHVRLLA